MKTLLEESTTLTKTPCWLLLSSALLPYLIHGESQVRCTPSYDMVALLLEAGADVNENARNADFPGHTVWQMFLLRCYHDRGTGLWPVARLLLSFGARLDTSTNPTSDESQVVSAAECVRKCCSEDDAQQLDEILMQAAQKRSWLWAIPKLLSARVRRPL